MNWKFTLFAVLVMVSVSAYAVISECSDGSEAASDDSGSCGDNVTYVFDSSTGTLTISGSGDMYSYSSSGNAPWYPYSSDVKEVVIEDGVTSIDQYAFYKCSSLASVTIPDSVTSIDQYAFSECSSLASVTIPDSVTSIGSGAFKWCSSLVSVTIPDSVTSIGYGAFTYCTSLTSIVVAEGNTVYRSVDGVLFSNDVKTLVQYPVGRSDDSYIIPDSVTSIVQYAFSGYYSSLTSVTIPDSVTFIGQYAFFRCSSLTSVAIPDSVTSIDQYAFSECSSLTSVTIPDSVTFIGDYAFYRCSSLASVTIPDSVTSIGKSAFYKCSSLTSVTIPDSVTSIGSYAFRDCTGLRELTLPISISATGSEYNCPAFYGCTNIEKVTFTPGTGKGYDYFYYNYYTPWYYSRAVLKEVVIEDGVTSIGSYAFYWCSPLTSVTIPDGVTSIGSYAFEGCTSLVSITIPDSVTSIGSYAFSRCSSLTSVTIPDSVTFIGQYAFFRCSSLTSVAIPDSVTSIDQYAFSGCSSLTSVTIPDSVTSIGSNAFYGCSSLTSVTIPDGVTSIGQSAFYECTGLRELTIPISVNAVRSNNSPIFYGCTNIEKVTFTPGTGKGYDYGTDSSSSYRDYYGYTPWYYSRAVLKGVVIEDGVTSISSNAFRGCSSLTSIVVAEGNTIYRSVDGVLFSKDMKTLVLYPAGRSDDLCIIPDGVTSIGSNAFYGCSSLTSVTIPDGVTSIGQSAFYECTGLRELTIPISVNAVRSNNSPIFYGCTNIEKVTFTPGTGKGYDYGTDSSSSYRDYYGYTPWYYSRAVLKEVVIEDGVTSIGSNAFRGCSSLASITIPDSVTSIDYHAFEDCTSLVSVTIPDSVTSIGYEAFRGCSSLISVTIPDSVTSISSDAFFGCKGLKELVIGNGVTSIGPYVFYGCSSLTSVTIPDGVTSISSGAFYKCSSLASVIIPDSVTRIGDYAFSGCTAVSSIRIGPDVSSIGNRAFGDIVFYDRDAVSVLSADANSLKGGCFVKTDDRMVKVDGHMMSFYVDGKVVYRGVFVEGDEDTPIPDVPFRPGYICSWEEFELGTEDVSVNAIYVLRELTVSFDPNGGSGSMDPVTTDVEHLFLRPENGFSAPDHMHFAGWAHSSDGEPIDFDGLRMADDAVLYALWAWDQYDVVYKVDGETVFTDTFGYGTEVTVRDMFQKTGYTVTGWSTDDAEVSDGKFVLGASDVVFDAASTVNQYDVVYKVDGEMVFTDTFDYGTEVTVRDMFQKTGYTVTEWSTDDAEVLDGKFVLGASDVTFSAVSAVNKYSYTVEYVDGDGNAIADPVHGTADYGSTVDAEIKTIAGYAAPSGISHMAISEDESKNVVTCVYTIIVYTITFDDGTVQTDVKYTVKDSSVDEPMVTKKKGYAGAWEEYVLDLTDKTVKAVYTPGYYRVEFVSEDNVFFWYDLEPGKEITLPSDTPSKDAEIRYIYTFSGWGGYTDGMVLGDDDVTFTAVFDSTVRKYA